MKPKKFFFLLSFAAILGGFSFYNFYFLKTPSYAVKEITQAVLTHDLEKFQHYVDVRAIMDRAFDDLISGDFSGKKNNILTRPLSRGLLRVIKPSIVQFMTEETLRILAAKAEEKTPPTAAAQDQADPIADTLKEKLQEKLPWNNLKFKSLRLNLADETTATLDLVMHNSVLNKDFTFFLLMRKNSDDVWRVEAISNLNEVLGEMAASEKT